MNKTTMNKTAIVIGATGLIGSNVVELLSAAKHISRIIVITRRPVEYAAEKVQNHVVDFGELNSKAHLFAGDILFSCLGTTAKQAGSISAQRLVDLEYQYNAAKIASEQGVTHYLLVSSSGADPRSSSAYLKMKGELEVKIKSLAFEYISILQPSLLLGQREQARFVEGIASKLLPALCRLPGLHRYRPIHGAQVAQKMVALTISPKESFEVFNLDEVFPD